MTTRRRAAALVMVLVGAVLVTAPGGPASAEQAGGGEGARLAAGAGHSCAVLATGQLRCWGGNILGTLGYGNTANVGALENALPSGAGPVSLGAGRSPVAITAGDVHTCALLDDGAVRCWGYNSDGQLGLRHLDSIGDDELPSAAAPVELGGAAVAITAGGVHTCAILDGGAVRCWGGALGIDASNRVGDDEHPSSVPVVDLGGPAVAIAAGGSHRCAVLVGGAVRCWGSNSDGKLGLGHTDHVTEDDPPASVPVVDLGGDAIAISAGGSHSCAVLVGGAVRCWGYNSDGQLGLGHTDSIGDDDDEVPSSVAPVDLPGPAVAIAAGGQHTCAILDGGAVRCWGNNIDGQLGLGHTEPVGDDDLDGIPVADAGSVDLGGPADAIAAGNWHTCARRAADGRVFCWGRGLLGRLGYGNTGNVGAGDGTPSVLAAGPVSLTRAPAAASAAGAVAGVGEATVSWSATTDDGGLPVTYDVTVSPGTGVTGGVTRSATASPFVFTGLAGGTEYTFTVVAKNDTGAAAGVTTAGVTPTAPLPAPRSAPRTPTRPTTTTTTRPPTTTTTVARPPVPASPPVADDPRNVALPGGRTLSVSPEGRVAGAAGDLHGDIPDGKPLNAPVVGLTMHWSWDDDAGAWAPTGYWLVAADGGVFSFGTAPFLGSMGDRSLNAPVLAVVPTPSGAGYWLVAADGGVFTFGDAPFHGSGAATGRRFTGLVVTASGRGYWLVTDDGDRLAYGDAV